MRREYPADYEAAVIYGIELLSSKVEKSLRLRELHPHERPDEPKDESK